MLTVLLVVVGVLAALRLLFEFFRDRRLPPGPRRLPLIGNLHQIPLQRPWLTYDRWCKQYGPLVSCQQGLTTTILVGDPVIAQELLSKQAASGRPRMVMFVENMGRNMYSAFGRYDQTYRLHQRMETLVLKGQLAPSYAAVQDMESKQTLYELLSSNDFVSIFNRYNASVIFSLIYGKRIVTGMEPEMDDYRQRHVNSDITVKEPWLVNFLPFLNRLPRPLAPWKKVADKFFEFESRVHMQNLQYGLHTPAWNWTKEFVGSKEAQKLPLLEVAYDLGLLVDAGYEAPSAVMFVFVLAALTAPEAMRKAQKELDDVVGSSRLPGLEDKDRLPYVNALVDETQRWRTISPFAFPHAMLEDVDFQGYRIPKGATVLPLTWTMGLDESRFDSPFDFQPERWLTNADNGRFTNWWGYGRRACAGRYIGKNSLFLVIARVLWGFDLGRVEGDKIDTLAFTTGLLSAPEPFRAVFKPRSTIHRDVIEREWATAEKDINVLMDQVRSQQMHG